MKKLILLLAAITSCALGQSIRYDNYNVTSAKNVPVGASAPVLTLPFSTVTVCAFDGSDSPCAVQYPIFSDEALTIPITQPMQSDAQGRFGFWIAPGVYKYSVVTAGGSFSGSFPITLISPQGPRGPTGIPGGSLSYPGVTSDGAGGLSKAMTVFNVKGYGAVGDGTTDDTAAVNLAINALNTAGGGVLYFPIGSYFAGSCNFILANSTIVRGDGASTRDSTTIPINRTGVNVPASVNTPGSTVICSSPTGTLFTVTGNSGKFENISLLNTSTTTPTAGAAIFTNSSYHSQRIDYDNIWVWGFFDGIHVGVGNSWVMTNSQIYNTVRYGLKIENTILTDAGDWTVTGNIFASGPRTGANSAAVYQTSSGGGKLIGNKVNGLGTGAYTHGFWFNLAGSVQGQTIGNNIEVTSADCIYIQAAWPWLTFTDNMLIAPAGFSGIRADVGLNNVYIGGGTINTLGAGAQYAVDLHASGQSITVAPFATNLTSWSTALTNITTDVSVNNFNLTSPDLTTRRATAVAVSADIGGQFLAANTLSNGGELAIGSNGNGHTEWINNSVLQADTNRVINAHGGIITFETGETSRATITASAMNVTVPISGTPFLSLSSTPGLPCTTGANAGVFNYVNGGVGAKDTVQVCAKDVTGAWGWRAIY